MASPREQYEAAMERLSSASQDQARFNAQLLAQAREEEARRRQELENARKPSIKKALTGALMGAGSGAAAGTMVAPGIGSAVGGVLGGLAGGALGYFDDSGVPVSSQQTIAQLGQSAMLGAGAYQAAQDKQANRDLFAKLYSPSTPMPNAPAMPSSGGVGRSSSALDFAGSEAQTPLELGAQQVEVQPDVLGDAENPAVGAYRLFKSNKLKY